jgi:hypothetical protein
MSNSIDNQARSAGANYSAITQLLVDGRWINWSTSYYTNDQPDANGMFSEVGYHIHTFKNFTSVSREVPSSYFKGTKEGRILPFRKLID